MKRTKLVSLIFALFGAHLLCQRLALPPSLTEGNPPSMFSKKTITALTDAHLGSIGVRTSNSSGYNTTTPKAWWLK